MVDTSLQEHEADVMDDAAPESTEPAVEKTTDQILRERREAAMGGPNVDGEIHRSLPLTRVAYALLACTVLGYVVFTVAGSSGNQGLEYMAGIATSVLFLVTFVVWFASRRQAKKLTEIKYAEQRQVLRDAVERRKREEKEAKAAKKRRRKKK
uniref:hypothetical protein n=1 Tax=Collinsella sp. BA40 TaxID=2560852 RepID=UPI00164EE012|nr:hypothetical protein [Collinsella sp. BA40]